MKNVDLSTTINGIRFENPFILASAPPTASEESIRNSFEEGWAGAVVKTVRPDSVFNSNVSPRFATLKESSRVIGFQNIEMLSDKSMDYWVKTIEVLKKDYPAKVLIASIMGADKASWQLVVKEMYKAGADALELNFSCPNGVTHQGLGLSIGQDNESIQRITTWVKEVSRIPVLVKLTPNVTDIAASARAAVLGGADGLVAINTVSCLIGVDLDTLSPLPNVNGYSTYGGYSGIAVKPIGLRCVAQICKAVDAPVHGMGGISNWKDALEYIALGASVVQVCTEVMLKGYSIIKPMIAGFTNYMESKGFSSLDEIRGLALAKVVNHNDLSREYKVVASIQAEKCVSCSKCRKVCRESGYHAVEKAGDAFKVDFKKCDGCSLCTYVCESDAISMIAREEIQCC